MPAPHRPCTTHHHACDCREHEHQQLFSLLADIRAAVGDPTGRLMQDELVQHCRQLLQRAQRGETLLEQVRLTLIECGHNCDEQTLHRLRTACAQATHP